MGKPLRKAQKKLKERQDEYDVKYSRNPGFIRPGSMNPRKSTSAGFAVKGRR